MCADLRSEELLQPGHVNQYGYTIAELDMSVLRLATDQFSPGYCVLICKRHVAEPHQLDAMERAAFLADLTRAGQAVLEAMAADKMNYALLGNAVPHTHSHLIPRYHGDPAGGMPLFGDPENPTLVPEATYQDRADRIRAAL